VVIIASLLVCFLLGFFQPFGIDRFGTTTKLYIVTGFTLITAVFTSIVGYLFPFVFRNFYDPSKWTVGKSIINNILIILLIAVGNSLFDWCTGNRPVNTFIPILLFYIAATFLIGIIPALVSIFIVQNNALRKNLHDAVTINNLLAKRLQDEIRIDHIESGTIELSGETKEAITLYPDSILYLESSGNYIRINYIVDNKLKNKQIRTTIAKAEQELHDYPYIVRCHRAYMVNILHIINVEGNSQGLQLHLQYLKEKIPVSRSYIKKVKDKL